MQHGSASALLAAYACLMLWVAAVVLRGQEVASAMGRLCLSGSCSLARCSPSGVPFPIFTVLMYRKGLHVLEHQLHEAFALDSQWLHTGMTPSALDMIALIAGKRWA